VIEQITYRLFMRRLDASALYESSFVDYSSKGVDSLFNTAQVDKLISVLDDVTQRAAAQPYVASHTQRPNCGTVPPLCYSDVGDLAGT
jgi:hypothetical protein